MFSGIVLIGLLFSPLAGAMAFLVTYEEYQHHGFGQLQLVWRSFQAAAVTALFFAVLGLALGVILPRLFVT